MGVYHLFSMGPREKSSNHQLAVNRFEFKIVSCVKLFGGIVLAAPDVVGRVVDKKLFIMNTYGH